MDNKVYVKFNLRFLNFTFFLRHTAIKYFLPNIV